MFIKDAILKFNDCRGFSQSYWILCPVCWNSGIKVTKWEDGTEEIDECRNCVRFIQQNEK